MTTRSYIREPDSRAERFRLRSRGNVSLRRPPGKTAGLILAAGASTRMGSPKQLSGWKGRTFLEWIIDSYRGAGLPFAIVLGQHGKAVQHRLGLPEWWLIWNAEPELGPLHSLHLGMRRLGHYPALLVHAVDHPLVQASTLRKLDETSRLHPECVLLPSFQGRKGHPVLFPRRFYRELREAPLDEGARWVVHQNRASVLWVPVKDPGIHANLNCPRDLEEWRRRLGILEPARIPDP